MATGALRDVVAPLQAKRSSTQVCHFILSSLHRVAAVGPAGVDVTYSVESRRSMAGMPAGLIFLELVPTSSWT